MSEPAIEQLLATTGLDELYPVVASLRMTPGWHKKRPSLWKEPRTEFRPLHWRYDVGRAALDQAGRWIGTDLAERRNYLLFNPVGDNDYDTVRTLVVAFQMIKPGEYARAHRHTPNAMRLILDAGPGCYTVVDGIKLPMRTGDFLLTPGGCWHSHYNEGEASAYWIDVLDVPLVHLLEPMFFEDHPDRSQKVVAEPAEHPFYFPPQRTLPALAAAPGDEGMQRLTLETAQHIPTVDINLLKFAAGAGHDFGRNTASRVFAVVAGRGTARIGELTAQWARGDVIAVPSWSPHEIRAHEDAVLLEVCDEPVLRKLGFYREGTRPAAPEHSHPSDEAFES
ncbi:cupin domain-containing protein [Aromatoleum aromaticum]|uniref:cupin domain-containing protein n=1 Tax=Aromatoleum aromaticum TaxID=551760 RepID=UPI00145947FF|nr:cupin domain-containing protein [Aromatoleum aromaticum]NMG54864.1 cupin domain-containing protein [Aromatoleum aromaticum]